jgi:hypothetical protein
MALFGIAHTALIPLRASDSDRAEIVSQLLFGESVEVLEKNSPWIKVKCIHDGYEGFVDEKQFIFVSKDVFDAWQAISKTRLAQRAIQVQSEDGPEWIYQGSLLPTNYTSGFSLATKKYNVLSTPFELIRNNSIIEVAQGYLNTPYLWGGRSITGIDCSGYTQIVFAQFNKALKRDASQQVEEGIEIAFNAIQAGDLAFFHNAKGKVIHVGILTGMGTILHASGKVREDKIDPKGIYREDSKTYTHELTCVRRYI